MLVGLGGNVRVAVRVGRMGLVSTGVSVGNDVTVGNEGALLDVGTIVAESVVVTSGASVVRIVPATELHATREPRTIMTRIEKGYFI